MIICLTGGLASGKSTAVKHLANKGAHVIDADVLGHRAYEPGNKAHAQIISEFGKDVCSDGDYIDRRVLGSLVFGKPDKLKKLTDIVWPEIRRMVEEEITSVRNRNPDQVIVLEAAVLFEAGWQNIGDEVWVIAVDKETAVQRSMLRDSSAREDVEKRLDAQLTNDQRTSLADQVIENNLDEITLLRQLDLAWRSSTGRQ